MNITGIRIVVPNRYGNEDIPDDFPGLNEHGTVLTLEWDVTGKIHKWPVGRAAHLHMKVTDEGCYYLLNGQEVIMQMTQDYVPHSVVPGKYGDYVVFDIDSEGRICGYKPDLEEISEERWDVSSLINEGR